MPYLDIGDTSVYYQERGSGPLAIFLHGFMMDHTLWLDQLAGLAHRRRCVSFDQRGFGRSDPISADVLDLDRYADDVDAVIRALGEESADLVGFSFGGAIALLTWQRHRERVRSLSVLSTGFGPAPNGAPPPPRPPGAQGTVEYLEGNAQKAVFQGKQVLFLQFNDYIFGPAGGRASLMARARYKSMFEGTRADMQVATFRTMQRARDLRSIFERVDVPVQLIAGELDIFSPAMAAEVASTNARAAVAVLDGVGRLAPIEDPVPFSAALDRFWE
jgi:pimeloyl-ACP methyl ester carboxylesterase